MTRRTRAFLFASGLIVLVGLGTGLVAVYSGAASAPAQKLSELQYVPADASVVAFADVRHIMNSEFRQRLRDALPDDSEKDKFLEEVGIDIERDIDTVVAGIGPEGTEQRGPVVLLRGRFDSARIEQVAASHGGTAEEYKGRKLLRVPGRMKDGDAAGAGDWQEAGVAFLEPNLVALGQVDTIRRAIDAPGSGAVTSNASLMAVVNDVAATSNAWVAGSPMAVRSHDGLPDAVKEPLSTVEWFALSAGIDRAVTARLRAEAVDDAAGENLRGIVNGALSMARMMAGKDEKLAGLLNSIQATGTGTRMEISFTVPPDLVDLLTSAAPSLHTRPTP